jgi:putative sterol carrier protein/putative NADPH-quinone reductase
MKVLALNGSPRMKASSTYHMLKPLLEGMEGAGAETELIHIRELNLEFCIGCYACWVRTPGVCVHQDKDCMVAVLESFNTADLVIFGTPLYHFTMSGIMKTFIDRTVVRFEPWLLPHTSVPGVSGHPERFKKPEKILLVSACGLPEFEHFDSLVATFKQMARMENWEYVGEILRPFGEPLSRRGLQRFLSSYYGLLRQAGGQIVLDGRISAELQAELRKDLFPGGKQATYELSSAYWEMDMDRFQVPEEKRHAVPVESAHDSVTQVERSPQSLEYSQPGESGSVDPELDTIMMGMPTAFNPEAAGDLDATIQYALTGEGGGMYHLRIKDGKCTAHRGPAVNADLTINSPAKVWLAISRGELNGPQAYMDGRYQWSGDMRIMIIMDRLFNNTGPQEIPSSSNQSPDSKEDTPTIDKSILNCHDIIAGMPTVFDAEAAGDLTADIQFDVSGEEPGSYYLHVEGGNCAFSEGQSLSPTLTIHTPSELWLSISRGEMDGQAALMQQKYTVEGDFNLLLKLNDMFTEH